MKLPNRAKVQIVLIMLIVILGLLVIAQPAKAQDSNVVISRIHYNAGGNDWNNPNNEYVVLSNKAAGTVDMSGWTLSDEANHVFSFPNGFDLLKNGSVTIYSGSGTNTESKLYWGNGAIWNNGGDVAYLKDSAGGVVDRVEYSGGGTEWVRGVEEAKSLPGSLPEKVTVKITEVVDGDTVDIRLPSGAENTVRILGVDTPEIYHKNEAGEYDNIDNLSYLKKWGYKAKSYVENLVENKKVTLVFDNLAGRVGYYGRWLGYITFDNKNLSHLLIKNGYARVYTEGDCRWEDNLVKSQNVAMNSYVGLWETLQPKEKPEITSVVVKPSKATLNVGGFENFYAIARHSNGENKYVTGNAEWTIEPPNIGDIGIIHWLSVEPPYCAAEFHALNAGEGTITANYHGYSGTAQIKVENIHTFITLDVPDKVAIGEKMSGSASITVPDVPGDWEADLSVSVYVDGNQVLSKTITIADGETTTVSIFYTFEKSGTHTVEVEGSISIGGRSFSGSKTVNIEVPTPKKVSMTGASFAIPETLKADIPKYKAGLPEKAKDRLPVQIPDTGFLLANEDNVLLVLSTKSDKGIANVEGWVLSKSLEVKEISVNVMVADTVSFEKEGTPVTVGEILSNPDKYRLDLVKVNAARRQVSILYDPDDGSGIEFPVTSGYLVENPETAESFLRKAIERSKEIIRENGKPSIVKAILQTERNRLPVFDFETDYWINSPAVTNGIVLPSGSRVIDILGKLTPALDRILQLDNGTPLLYDVETDLDYESVSSIDQIKENPEQFREKVVGFTAKGIGGGISIQETWEEQPPCGSDLAQIPTPQGPVCIDILAGVRLEGLAAWNKVSAPPKKTDFLLTGGASSIHQDRPYKQIKGRFRFVGRVRSTKEIDNSLPGGMALVIYDKKKIGDIDYRAMAERAKGIMENKVENLNFGLTGFSEGVPLGIPVNLPEIRVGQPEKLPETIPIEKGKKLDIQKVKPETPVDLDISKSAISGVNISVRNKVGNVEISIQKQPSIPPEIEVEPLGEVYRSIDISVKNLPEDEIENAEITFWVLKEWLSAHDFGKGDVMLQRFHAGGWENLPTELADENATHFKYSAQTPGFSTFAITAAKAEAGKGVPAPMKLRSNALEEGERIPVQYTADGKNISPPFTIENVPDQAESLALVAVDLDTPGGKFTHWVMWNIPVDTNSIPRDVPKTKTVEELGGAKQGKNDFGEIGYGGPSPPKGSSHRYRFTLYALDKELELSTGAAKGQLMDRLENHVLQKSELVGVYKRPEEGGEGLPWTLIGGVIIVVIATSAFVLYRKK